MYFLYGAENYIHAYKKKSIPLPNMKNSLELFFFQSDPSFSLFRNEMFIFDEIVYWIVSKFAVFFNPKYIFFQFSFWATSISSNINLLFLRSVLWWYDWPINYNPIIFSIMFHKDSQDSQREIGRPSFPPQSYHSQAGSWENVKILSHCVLFEKKEKI